MILAYALAFGSAIMPGPPPRDPEPYEGAPSYCWSDVFFVPDGRSIENALDGKRIASALLGHAARAYRNDDPHDATVRSRVAEKLDRPARTVYTEVQYFICDREGNVLHKSDDPQLPRIHLHSRSIN